MDRKRVGIWEELEEAEYGQNTLCEIFKYFY